MAIQRHKGESAAPAPSLVIMGVSGVGKSTIGVLIAEALGLPFRDADSFHSKANIEKMSKGIPLTDDDRWPWLQAIRAWLDALQAEGKSGVVTCSALKARYRTVLLSGAAGTRLVYLYGSRDLISARMAARKDHFMPLSLLDSQLATLEPPGPEERPILADVTGRPDEIAAGIIAALR